MELGDGVLRDECLVQSIRKSLIPNVLILNLQCQGSNVELDLLRELLVVSEGGKAKYLLSREKPEYDERRDFVAWGYVIGKKVVDAGSPPHQGKRQKLIVSLWGYMVMIESGENINNCFNVMDKVYFKLSPAGSEPQQATG
ncbi:MAG: DNA-directed RNA polymerase subunit G [Zestosphaera sp.]